MGNAETAGTNNGAVGNTPGTVNAGGKANRQPLLLGESVNPATGAVVGQPLQPHDLGYTGQQ
jgi:hypothetical protein